MPIETYTTAHGEALALNLTPEEAVWLAEFRRDAADPTITIGALTDRAYSDQNPMLGASPIPGRGWVTAEVHARPAYRALIDVLYVKTVQVTGSDGSERFTVSVADAASELGISEPAVRLAMRESRLPSMVKGRRKFTTPEAVAGYQVSNRGPRSSARTRRAEATPLTVRRGSRGGQLLQVSHDGAEAGKDPVTVSGWSRVFVRTTMKATNSHRFWELQPGPTQQSLRLGDFEVTGRFEVVRKINNGREALAAWKGRPRS